MDFLEDHYRRLVTFLFESVVQPAMYALGLMEWAEDAFGWLDFFLFGLVQVAVVYLVCRPLEAWKPVERGQSARAVRTDMIYTLLARLGLLPLLGFVLFATVQVRLEALLADSGWIPPTLEDLLPALRDAPFQALLVYIVVLDFFEYWRHRFQHEWRWWWALHSLHHAQAHMTFWTDDRNHVLDDIIGAAWIGGLAVLIGVPPGQFPLILMVLRVAESLSHANARIHFGWLGERLLVSPRFHRLHHGVLSVGAAGRNYAVLLPVWDWIFGTADFKREVFPPTGDPAAPAGYVQGGWLRQQWAGLGQVARAVWRRKAGQSPAE
jgi:sterol desaturase/sphingolipid hydroxylase (fatty acid hydroxylase superfamily)